MKPFGCLCVGLNFLSNECKLRHKDMKPADVLIHQSHVLFTALGSAIELKDGSGITEGVKPVHIIRRYAVPETLKREQRNIKTDLFALGCIFARVLTVLSRRTVGGTAPPHAG